MSSIQINKSILGVQVVPGEYEVMVSSDRQTITFVRRSQGGSPPPRTQGFPDQKSRNEGSRGPYLSNAEKIRLAEARPDLLDEYDRDFISTVKGHVANGRKLSDKQFAKLNKIVRCIEEGKPTGRHVLAAEGVAPASRSTTGGDTQL